jgi:predicted phage baseplate assembly protein
LSPATQQLLAAYDGTSALTPQLHDALVAEFTGLLETWLPVRDLLESGGNDPSFVAEMDNDGYGHLRFGSGQLGRMPDAGMAFQAAYRTGNGTSGNVGAETITYLVLREEKLSGPVVLPRNPLAASGGVDPEPISEVKWFAPYAFRNVLERAITGNDYAVLAADNYRRLEERPAPSAGLCEAPFVKLQGAKATLRWTGSWYEALVAVDPLGSETARPELLQEIEAYLEPYRRMGQDLTVEGAAYVPLDLALAVCVLPDYLRGQVEAALLDVFSNTVLPDGSKGFFHPDNLTFGEGVYVSRIVAAAQAVTGVASVSVERLERYQVAARPPSAGLAFDSDEVPPLGVLTLGPFEIAQLDNDPSFPENGRLELALRGGR